MMCYCRGYLNNPIVNNEPREVAFIPGKKRGSVLCVTWKSGHVLFYHLLYLSVCFESSINVYKQTYQLQLLSLPELLSHFLYITIETNINIQNRICLHRQRNSILCLI